MKTVELQPITSHKSFYGKARMIHEGDTTKLMSYNTIVAKYNHKTNKMEVYGWYSATTARHINAFLSHFGFDTCSKAELEDYK